MIEKQISLLNVISLRDSIHRRFVTQRDSQAGSEEIENGNEISCLVTSPTHFFYPRTDDVLAEAILFSPFDGASSLVNNN